MGKEMGKEILRKIKEKSFLRKIIDAIQAWFHHTTVFWIAVDNTNNVRIRDACTIFDRALPSCDIKILYNSGIILEDKDWHWIGIVFRRFGKQELYLDGKQVTNAHFS